MRRATSDDADGCARIYAPYVRDTATSFETEPPSTPEMAARIRAAIEWRVEDDHDGIVGYACAVPHRQREAYRFACEVSVYVDAGLHRRGVGRALYGELLEALERRGYRMACAGITLPNAASVELHAALGFTTVGTYRDIGWKNDAWHDVLWMQRPLGPAGEPPLGEPR